MLETIKRALAKKKHLGPSKKELEVMELIRYVQRELAVIRINFEQMSDEEMTVVSLRYDAMEKSYYYLFNQLRVLRGLPSFTELHAQLKGDERYDEWKERYRLDSIPTNTKFIGAYNYLEPNEESTYVLEECVS